MKGKQHFYIGGMTAAILTFILIIGPIFLCNGLSFNCPYDRADIIIPAIIYTLIFIPIGNLLPDSDSESKGSFIFYIFKNSERASRGAGEIEKAYGFIIAVLAFPFAFMANFLEHPISLITKRHIGHRQSLHTIIGLLITSLVLSLSFYGVLSWINHKLILPINLIAPFIALFIGQLSHLICDGELKFS